MAAPASLIVEMSPSGLYLPGLGLHLDPTASVPRAFLSHAHGDHVGGKNSGVSYGSPETLALVAARTRARAAGARALGWDEAIELPVEGGGTARLSMAPAGHVLGAAQLVIDHPGGRLVYTGDYQSGPGLTHAAGAPVTCDTLIIESTFALPIFRFPDRPSVRRALVAWCRARLEEKKVPVVLAYSLGKSQEIVHALLDADLPVVVHGAIYRLCEAYESLGVTLGIGDQRVAAYAEEKERGRKLASVLIVPPSAFAHPMIRKLTEARVAYASGWALLDASMEQKRADVGFPLSDHADHDDLLATVRATGATRVYTTLGDARTLADLLRSPPNAGMVTALDAAALDSDEGRSE